MVSFFIGGKNMKLLSVLMIGFGSYNLYFSCSYFIKMIPFEIGSFSLHHNFHIFSIVMSVWILANGIGCLLKLERAYYSTIVSLVVIAASLFGSLLINLITVGFSMVLIIVIVVLMRFVHLLYQFIVSNRELYFRI
jgi:hypothetical protein